MKEVLMFVMRGCPYCMRAKKALKMLELEDARYGEVPVRVVDENREPETAARYDYYNVPSMFIEGEKKYEAKPGEEYEEIFANVKRVLDEALL